jgi:signal transduction histidine kinase
MCVIVERGGDHPRKGAGGGPPQVEDVDLREWLASHADTWSANARRGDIVLRTGDESLPVRASRAWLGQIVDTLVDNACKYGTPGEPIEIAARREGPSSIVEVTDHGPGMADDDRRRVFEPFFRSAEARRAGRAGLGLGLAIAARLADAMEGRIDVRSTPGEGSSFTLVLPTAAPVATVAAR